MHNSYCGSAGFLRCVEIVNRLHQNETLINKNPNSKFAVNDATLLCWWKNAGGQPSELSVDGMKYFKQTFSSRPSSSSLLKKFSADGIFVIPGLFQLSRPVALERTRKMFDIFLRYVNDHSIFDLRYC